MTYARAVQRTARATEYLELQVQCPQAQQQQQEQEHGQLTTASRGSSDQDSGSVADDAYVSFSVRWRPRGGGGEERMTETSHFKRVGGAWLYYAAVE